MQNRNIGSQIPGPLGQSPSVSAGRRADGVLAALAPVLDQILAALKEIRETLAGSRKPVYTVEEIGRLTGRAPYTVRRWIKAGRISATRVGGTGPHGRLLIGQDQLQQLIASWMGGDVPAVVAGD